jgi:hypothetical protein
MTTYHGSIAMSIEAASHPAIDVGLSDWSAAEFLDTLLGDGLILRALVCRLGAGKWQWSISSMAGDSGELICRGIEITSARAREMAAAEVIKCLDDPIR